MCHEVGLPQTSDHQPPFDTSYKAAGTCEKVESQYIMKKYIMNCCRGQHLVAKMQRTSKGDLYGTGDRSRAVGSIYAHKSRQRCACVTPVGASHETLQEKLLWKHGFGECFYDVSKEINIFWIRLGWCAPEIICCSLSKRWILGPSDARMQQYGHVTTAPRTLLLLLLLPLLVFSKRILLIRVRIPNWLLFPSLLVPS